jgi:hypothetical protein
LGTVATGEGASSDTVPNAIRNWIGLRPEERWWLYTVTAAATGGPEHSDIGWRKALRFALTENPLAEVTSINPVKRSRLLGGHEPAAQNSLFDTIQEEPSPFFVGEGQPVLVKESAE